MVRGSGSGFAAAPGPEAAVDREVGRGEQWRNSYNSAEAVSFGFVATAILISMFVVMAIFERFIRPRTLTQPQEDGRSSIGTSVPKLEQSPPKAEANPWGVSVLMPGEAFPTHIAQPAPPP